MQHWDNIVCHVEHFFPHSFANTTHIIDLAHLKGCIDPTGALPENQVFICGYTNDKNNRRALFGDAHPKIFLSRSPCLEPTDAKIVSVVGSKPHAMCMNDWDLLCGYKFGTVIFPQSLSIPLVTIIAGRKCSEFDYCCRIASSHHRFSLLKQVVILMEMVRDVDLCTSFCLSSLIIA